MVTPAEIKYLKWRFLHWIKMKNITFIQTKETNKRIINKYNGKYVHKIRGIMKNAPKFLGIIADDKLVEVKNVHFDLTKKEIL